MSAGNNSLQLYGNVRKWCVTKGHFFGYNYGCLVTRYVTKNVNKILGYTLVTPLNYYNSYSYVRL